MPVRIPSSPLFSVLRKLDLPAKNYVVFGSGPLWVRGLRESHDLDILARGSAWERAKQVGQLGTVVGSDRPVVRIPGMAIEIFDTWYPGAWDEQGIIDRAEMIDGLPFASLADVQAWKKRMGRPKDLADLRLLAEYVTQPSQ